MEAVSTFAGGIAHNFNNILGAIIGNTELARLDATGDLKIERNLRAALKAGIRARDLVQQILAFSSRAEEERKPLMIQPIVKDSLKLLTASLPATIKIRKNMDTQCGPILAVPTQVHQVVMNLCTNAYHAMRDKGGLLEVILKEEYIGRNGSGLNLPPGTYLRLSVSDTGHGMNEEILDRIFNPYYTTKPPGEGTGMGLSVVHGIVTSLGGDIRVLSEPGQGSTFHVYLPRTESEVFESKSFPNRGR